MDIPKHGFVKFEGQKDRRGGIPWVSVNPKNIYIPTVTQPLLEGWERMDVYLDTDVPAVMLKPATVQENSYKLSSMSSGITISARVSRLIPCGLYRYVETGDEGLVFGLQQRKPEKA